MNGDIRSRLRTAGIAMLPLVLMIAFVKIAWPTVPRDEYLIGAIEGSLVALVSLGRLGDQRKVR